MAKTDFKRRLKRIERKLKPKQNRMWWQNCTPFVMFHIYLEDYGLELTNDEFSELTGLSGPFPYDADRNDEMEQQLIDTALEVSEKSEITVEDLLYMFHSTDDDNAKILYPINAEPPRTGRKIRVLKTVDGDYIPNVKNILLWYCCLCWHWRKRKEEHTERMKGVVAIRYDEDGYTAYYNGKGEKLFRSEKSLHDYYQEYLEKEHEKC